MAGSRATVDGQPEHRVLVCTESCPGAVGCRSSAHGVTGGVSPEWVGPVSTRVAAVTDPIESRAMNESMQAERQDTEVRRVRTWMTLVLERENITTPQQTDRALVMVSELVTNVLRHTTSVARIRIRTTLEGLLIEVSDRSATEPVMQPAGGHGSPGHGGHGLRIVDASATRWGVEHPTPLGKTVWCSIALFGGGWRPAGPEAGPARLAAG